MEQIQNLADERLVDGCIYCGGPPETRDHVPSRVLLEPPVPENLPVVPACSVCNRGFSHDEEYVACLVESAIAGSTDPDDILRPGVAKVLRRQRALRARIEAARTIVDGRVIFAVEPPRLRNVVLKLARGHAAFELSQSCRENPSFVWWCLLDEMSLEARDSFDAVHVVGTLGEIGSRQTQRLMVVEATLAASAGSQQKVQLVVCDWVDVQEANYRYLAIDGGSSITIKMIIREYLACQVSWDKSIDGAASVPPSSAQQPTSAPSGARG